MTGLLANLFRRVLVIKPNCAKRFVCFLLLVLCVASSNLTHAGEPSVVEKALTEGEVVLYAA